MIFSFVLMLFGIGAFCALLYYAAVYALPGAIGFEAGYWAIQSGAGAVGGIVIGFLVGGLVFVIGQALFSMSRSNMLRIAVAMAFVVPALVAGYNGVYEFAGLTGVSGIWQHVYAVAGAMAVGVTAFMRLMSPTGQTAGAIRLDSLTSR